MDIDVQPKLSFKGVDIIQVDFNSIKSYKNSRKKINIDVDPKVSYDINSPKLFRIIMGVSLECEGFFQLSITAIGHFAINRNIDERIKQMFINSNAPAIMFPYIRSFITTFSSNLGQVTGSLVLPPQLFKGRLEEANV